MTGVILDKESMLDEHWVAIDGFPNYQVSNYGRVCNIKTGYDLTPRVTNQGYCTVALHNEGYRKDATIHRLVAKAFFVDYDDSIEIKHVNGNRQENTVLNLTLGTRLKVAVRIVETGEEFDSMMACGEYLGGTAKGVQGVISGYRKTYKGHTFEVIDKVVA